MKSLKDIRESRGIMKGAVAKAIGVTYPTYQKYEANPRLMTIEQLEKACSILGCRVADIFLD